MSRTTVSFVLNNVEAMQISDETKKRVHDAVRELGYVPDAAAQALASGRSKTVGLLLARRPEVIASDMYLTNIMEVLAREIKRQGMRLLLEVVEDYENPESFLKLVRSNSIDGVLYSGPRVEDTALRHLVDHHIPTVLMGELPGSPYPSVDVNNRSAARLAVSHLIQLGHRNIACITNASPSYAAAIDRLHGYRDALQAVNIAYTTDLVRYGDFDPESGYLQMNSLLDSGAPVSAVFVASDVVAYGAMAAIREHGLKIPKDIALVGFDDAPISRYVDPALTTICLPIADLARLACQMLVNLIRNIQLQQDHLLLEANLLIRKSCGALAG